jgi:hypothetical protein
MSAKLASFALPLVFAALPVPQAAAPSAAAPRGTVPAAAARTAPARAFKVGADVIDRRGALIGTVAGVGQNPNGTMQVVVKVNGKLISLPETALSFEGDRLVSARTKAELLAAAPPP